MNSIKTTSHACCGAAILLLFICSSQAQVITSPQNMRAQTNEPVIYRDAGTGITLSVESDGRHVVATNDRNETIWRVDPFSDAKLEPYRTATPRIVYIGPDDRIYGPSKEPSAMIGFNSTQFGRIILSTGEFIFMGQD